MRSDNRDRMEFAPRSRFQFNRNDTAVRKSAGLLGVLAFTFALAPAASAQTLDVPSRKVDLVVETVASGLAHPWAVEVLPDGAYIVTEKTGNLRIVRDGTVSAPIAGMPRVAANGQGGLLDVALARDFGESRILFLTYSTAGNGGYATAVARARLAGDERRLEDVERIFVMNRFSARGQHFGARIAIAPDGNLFFGIGDRGEMDRAQDPYDHAGSILRITPDGSVPATNPHVQSGEALPEIWSIGHRNPQGLDIDPENGALVTAEHGARGGDEINMPEPGKNYGWPVISYGKHYSGAEIGRGTAARGYEQPVYYWDPSIAPGAVAVYRGDMFPEWNGDLLVAALKYQLIARLERDGTGAVVAEERLFDGAFGRIRDVKVAPDGALLMVTDAADGALLRVSRAEDLE